MKQNFTTKIFLVALLFSINLSGYAQQVVLKGEVQDFLTQQVIPGASVKVKRLVKKFVNGEYTNERIDFKGIIVDSSGRFEVRLPKNEYVIEASSIGYIRDSKFINLKSDLTILLTLSGETNNLDEVEIKSQKAESNVRDVQSSVIKLNMQSLKKLPIVFGEGDIIRALTLQPGVTTVGEGAGGFNVRGGKTDQNLVLIDDAPIFNTSHLLGLFTSVNPEAVQSANLYKGNVPARYGGRLSSLLNITSKTQTSEAKRAIGAGPISGNLFLQQPFSKDKGSILLAGRVAYPNLILKALPKRFRGSKAFFYDLNTAVQFRIHPKHSIKLTGYQSSDDFKFPEDTSYNWNSQAATAQLNSILSDKLSLSVKGILSHYTFGVNGLAKGLEFELASKIRHHEVRADLAYDLKKHKIETGASVIYYRFSPGNQRPTEDSSAVVARNIADDFGREASAYLSHEWTISKRISLSSGLRFAQFDNVGPNKVFVYEANNPLLRENIIDTVQYEKGQKSATYGGIEPRFGVKFELSDHQSIKASYNRTRQFLHLISNTTAISPIDYWKLSGKYIKPQVADQYSLGFYQNFAANSYETYVEGFYKTMQNQIEYKDGADLILNPHLETELVPASGVAYGVELSVQKTKGRFTGNLGYTWSRTFIKTNSDYDSEQINGGSYYPSLFDKPHNLSLLGQYFLGKGWTFSSTFIYQTGRPITYPDGQFVYNQDLILNYSRRNADRLPDFHRMDVSLSRDSRKTKNQKKYNIVNISFYNLYARKNPYSIFFRQYLNVNRSYRLAVLGTIVPSLTLTKYW